MSINSPAKQERIERHLMRQRGAGVRTVSANFGFFFGSSQPSSNDVTPAREEPPQKRQKTGLENVIYAAEAVDDAVALGTVAEPVKKTKQAKSRKRWIAEEDSQPRPSKPVVSGEDSFVAGIESKKLGVKNKKNAKLSAKGEEQVEAVVSEPAAKGRPRRRAAATAAVKVADGFAEEAAPIDKKRRDVGIERKARKTRGNQNTAPVVDLQPPPDTMIEQAEPKSDGQVEGRSKNRKANKPPPEDSENISFNNAVPKKGGRKKRKVEATSDDPPATETVSNPTRQPLKETNMNATIRSISPEKPSKTKSKDEATVSPPKTENPPKRAVPTEHNSSRPAKRGKVSVRQDQEDVRQETAVDVDSGARPEKPNDAPKHSEPPPTQDEDIDWMFEPQQRKALPTIVHPRTASAVVQKSAKTRAKMPDIDLDDLLSDIASLAKKDRVSEAGPRAASGLETGKTSRGRKKKG